MEPSGCSYDEENCSYEFNEGLDYPVNPFDIFGDDDE